MITLDPGHEYALSRYDGEGFEYLRFLKREGVGFPGNVGHYEGTNCQEVLRVLIDRVKYLHEQAPCNENLGILRYLRTSLYLFERRAAIRHGRTPPYDAEDETKVSCVVCGHVTCEHLDANH